MLSPRSRRSAVLAAALAGAALTTVSCLNEQGAKVDGKPAITSMPMPQAGAELRLPLDAYMFSPAQLQVIGRAYRVLVHQCMRRRGFDYRAPEPPPRRVPHTWNTRRYGVTEKAAVAIHGYRLEEPSAG